MGGHFRWYAILVLVGITIMLYARLSVPEFVPSKVIAPAGPRQALGSGSCRMRSSQLTHCRARTNYCGLTPSCISFILRAEPKWHTVPILGSRIEGCDGAADSGPLWGCGSATPAVPPPPGLPYCTEPIESLAECRETCLWGRLVPTAVVWCAADPSLSGTCFAAVALHGCFSRASFHTREYLHRTATNYCGTVGNAAVPGHPTCLQHPRIEPHCHRKLRCCSSAVVGAMY